MAEPPLSQILSHLVPPLKIGTRPPILCPTVSVTRTELVGQEVGPSQLAPFNSYVHFYVYFIFEPQVVAEDLMTPANLPKSTKLSPRVMSPVTLLVVAS